MSKFADSAKIVRYFLERIEATPEGCWVWTGYVAAECIPAAEVCGRRSTARRIIMGLSDKDGGLVVATCENKLCVNPSHLRIVRSARKAVIRPSKGADGNLRYQPRLSDDDKAKAIGMMSAGVTQQDTARILGVSQSTISRIVKASES